MTTGIDVFVRNPEYAFMTASVFALATAALALFGRERGPRAWWSLLAASILWYAYAYWEVEMKQRGMDIRVDLLLIYPALAVCSVGAALHAFSSVRNPKAGR
jgi:hypothetical protein